MASAINIGRVAEAYNAIRDARTAKRHAWEKEDVALEADQDKLKAVLLQLLNTSGANSVATDFGTVYRSEKLKPSAADWDAIWAWAKANDAMDLFERRLKTTFIKEFMDENDGALPPGINAHREYEVTVRRPTAKKE